MLTVTKRFKFEAAHSLPNYKGNCHNLHGHSYNLEVTVTGPVENDSASPTFGMIIDFSELSRIVKQYIVNKYDHQYLNDYFDNPTAENMCVSFGKQISEHLPTHVILKSVKLWETDSSYAEYTPEYYSMGDFLMPAT